MWHVTGALDEVDWLRNKLERLETSISAMARTAGGAPSEGGAAGNGPQSSGQPGQAKEYRYDKSVFMLSARAQCSCSALMLGAHARCSCSVLMLSAEMGSA